MTINSNKLTLPLIIGIPLLGIVLTTLFYFFVTRYGIQLGTQNEGVLVSPPKQISALPVLAADGKPHVWNDGRGHWTFVVAGAGVCDAACQNKLYFARQTHRALGKGALRVDTVYLNLGSSVPAETAELLAREYAHFKILQVDADSVRAWAAAQRPALDLLQAGNLYVIDPIGWMMMYYTDAHSYKEVIKDMKFLLKNS